MSRITLGVLVCVLTGAGIARAQPPDPGTASRPNILFLFADDLCFEALGATGNSEVKTPNLDSLARRGVTFTHAYNMGSWQGAVCMPSRGMLNTGRYLWEFQQVDRQMDQQREAGHLWAQYLSDTGYRTYMAGKWHVRTSAEKTFNEVGSVRPGMPRVVPKTHPHAYNRPRPGVEDRWDPADKSEGGFWEGGTHWSEVLADEAIDFLTTPERGEQPFFMYVAFNAPHDPRQAPRRYLDMYPSDDIEVPANFLPEYPYKDDIGCQHSLRDEFLAPMPRTPHAVQVHRSEYYAIISHMDAQIGRILDALERSGEADNTWIFFTADHGLAVGQHGLLGKQNLYDHSTRPPFFVVGPGLEAGQRIDQPIYYQDVMPTTLELAGVAIPEHVDYQSLLPILNGTGTTKYPSIYTAYMDLQRSVTKDDWKLLLYPKLAKVRLFNPKTDPDEMHDLAADGAQAERVRHLFAELLRWQQETGDELDLTAVYPELR